MSVKRACESYFSGFSDLWNHRAHTNPEKAKAVTKIVLNLVFFPLSIAVGIVYGAITLRGRCSKAIPNSSTAQATSNAATSTSSSPLSVQSRGKPDQVLHLDDASEEEIEKYYNSQGIRWVTTRPNAERAAREERIEMEMISQMETRAKMKGQSELIDCSEEALATGRQRKMDKKGFSSEDISRALKALEDEGIDLSKKVYLFGAFWQDLTPEAPVSESTQIKTYGEVVTDILRMINLVIANKDNPEYLQSDKTATVFLHKELNPKKQLDPQKHLLNTDQYSQIGASPKAPQLGEPTVYTDLIYRTFETLKKHHCIQDYGMATKGVEILL